MVSVTGSSAAWEIRVPRVRPGVGPLLQRATFGPGPPSGKCRLCCHCHCAPQAAAAVEFEVDKQGDASPEMLMPFSRDALRQRTSSVPMVLAREQR